MSSTRTNKFNHLAGHAFANRFFVFRHGHSLANQKHLIVSDPAHGSAAYGLTPKGRAQVSRTVEKIKTTNCLKKHPLVFSSPFLRATETAEIIISGLGVSKFTTDSRLRERCFGDYELTPDTNYEKVWSRDEVSPNHKKGHVESANEVLSRIAGFVCEIDDQFKGKDIILVTHADTAMILECAFLGKSPRIHHTLPPIKTGDIRKLNDIL